MTDLIVFDTSGEKEYIKPEITIKYFLFEGDITKLSNLSGVSSGADASSGVDPGSEWWGGDDDL